MIIGNGDAFLLKSQDGSFKKYTEDTLEGVISARGITAGATQTQAGATQLIRPENLVTTVATAGDGVRLPDAVAGQVVIVRNAGAAALAVYPSTGEDINGGSANASISLAVGDEVVFVATDSDSWVTRDAGQIASVTTSATPASGSNGAQFTFKDRAGNAISGRRAMTAFLCDVNGDLLAAGTSLAVLTNGKLAELVAGRVALVETSSAGLLGVTLTHGTPGTYYLAFVLPSGRLLVSGALVVNA